VQNAQWFGARCEKRYAYICIYICIYIYIYYIYICIYIYVYIHIYIYTSPYEYSYKMYRGLRHAVENGRLLKNLGLFYK